MAAHNGTSVPTGPHTVGITPPIAADSKSHNGFELQEVEYSEQHQDNLTFDEEEAEPELHARTWIALAAMNVLVFTQVLALQGPPAVLTYIGTDLHNTTTQTWVVNALSLVQAVVGPILSTASDAFQARKLLLVGTCAIAFIGACIAPGSENIYRLIGASILIGFGFAAVPLGYAVPAEILPRRWRPMAQAAMNASALLATVVGPLTIGALIKRDTHRGWRDFYWFQAALWGTNVISVLFAYRPPKRHTELDNLPFWHKIRRLDLVGCGILMVGLTLFLTGTSLGGGQYTWVDARTLSPLIIGIFGLVAFGLYEWKGTTTGIVHHDLFGAGKANARTFILCTFLIFVEGLCIFAFAIFYPIMSQILFTTDPILVVLRSQAAWIPALLSTVLWGYASTHFRTIREPLLVGNVIMTAGMVGLATVQPGQSTNAIAFACVAGVGFGAPLVLTVSGAQLVVPHKVLATASAVTTTARAIGVAIFTAIFTAAFNTRLKLYLPEYIIAAAEASGLPGSSIPAFLEALTTGQTATLPTIPGATSEIIAQGFSALQQAYADSIRVVFIIAAPIGLAGSIVCLFLGDLKKTMNYRVDAPVEELHAKRGRHTGTETERRV
ncbi:hypothetical protein AYO21_00939 [Fonsecaea monophora]|uniref:Major facilitator superfamily (MFS) profile domain-containing protein n=1 Tax=Fonsecaea monophora TaxID=254056 RepID=A0A177FLA3_9EURO|nr:hypothetical protein AYO21_00939 [Fonsecaea monophora]OAG44977.1 hypothetical protein AYO21_00939 [Fonsecaea monophora]